MILPRRRGYLRYAHAERGRCRLAKTRREFTPEFKREAVALLESSGRL